MPYAQEPPVSTFFRSDRPSLQREPWPSPPKGERDPSSPLLPPSDEHLGFVTQVSDGLIEQASRSNPTHAYLEQIARCPVIHYATILLKGAGGSTPSYLQDLLGQERTPWHYALAARARYKQLLRCLLFLKDAYDPGRSPLALGTYLSGQGVVRAPLSAPGGANPWGQDEPELTSYQFPFECVMVHLEEPQGLPGRVQSLLAPYISNATPSVESKIFADVLAPSLLLPTTDPSGATTTYAFDEAGSAAARWVRSVDPTTGAITSYNRATVNLVTPQVRRWWTEKCLSYVDAVQEMAAEAVAEYLGAPPDPREDAFYAVLLPAGRETRHDLGWRHAFLWIDNTSPTSPAPLDSASGYDAYTFYDTAYRRSTNAWPFCATFLADLREQLHRRGMGLVLNASSPVNTCRHGWELRAGYGHMSWPFRADLADIRAAGPGSGARLVSFEQSIAFLQQVDSEGFGGHDVSSLMAESVSDGLYFERVWPPAGGKSGFLDALFPPSKPIYTVDGRLARPIGFGRTFHVSREETDQLVRWLRELSERGKGVYLDTILSSAEWSRQVPAMCALAWAVRAPGSSVCVSHNPFAQNARLSQGLDTSYLDFYTLPARFAVAGGQQVNLTPDRTVALLVEAKTLVDLPLPDPSAVAGLTADMLRPGGAAPAGTPVAVELVFDHARAVPTTQPSSDPLWGVPVRVRV